MKSKADRKKLVPRVFKLKLSEEERTAQEKFFVVRSAAYKIKSKINVVLQSADNICRFAAEIKQINSSVANERQLYMDECQSQCDIMLQLNITRRFNIAKWINPELKLQGPHKLLYGYR